MPKLLFAISFLWLMLGAAGALLVDRERPMRLSDVALGPITLEQQLRD
jgi:hypothetical protein